MRSFHFRGQSGVLKSGKLVYVVQKGRHFSCYTALDLRTRQKGESTVVAPSLSLSTRLPNPPLLSENLREQRCRPVNGPSKVVPS